MKHPFAKTHAELSIEESNAVQGGIIAQGTLGQGDVIIKFNPRSLFPPFMGGLLKPAPVKPPIATTMAIGEEGGDEKSDFF